VEVLILTLTCSGTLPIDVQRNQPHFREGVPALAEQVVFEIAEKQIRATSSKHKTQSCLLLGDMTEVK